MQVSSMTAISSNVSTKGSISKKTTERIISMGNHWIKVSSQEDTKPFKNVCLKASKKINDSLTDLSILMMRFCQGCELTHMKSRETGITSFFIQNKSSNYKTPVGNFLFSPKYDKLEDIAGLYILKKCIKDINQYKENSNFIKYRKPEAKSAKYDNDFIPEADYIFSESMLVDYKSNPTTEMVIIECLEELKKRG